MNLVIFGANGPVGKLLTQQALASGHARIDLADFMLNEAVNPRHIRKTVAIAIR